MSDFLGLIDWDDEKNVFGVAVDFGYCPSHNAAEINKSARSVFDNDITASEPVGLAIKSFDRLPFFTLPDGEFLDGKFVEIEDMTRHAIEKSYFVGDIDYIIDRSLSASGEERLSGF